MRLMRDHRARPMRSMRPPRATTGAITDATTV
jgi:hypothetical protein